MVSHRDVAPVPAGRSSATQKGWRKERRNGYGRDRGRPSLPASELVARLAVPKSKHKTILEWTENKDKKKKLEIEYTTNTQSPTNFSFVPLGNPELTTVCKDLSREQGALMYIVSTANEKGVGLSDHTHRVGYHFRTHIVEQAASMVEGLATLDFVFDDAHHKKSGGKFDPIPDTQEEVNKQADAAIRDLFPRIPNTDREMIIRHAFQKGAVFNGKTVVGLQEDLTLSRRVQLAVLAHIRHTHTRYDSLLRETSWENARRAVEPVCLDILVKWRGDEETGRDQLDEVLREIVVIDDSEDEGDEEESEEGSEDETDGEEAHNPNAMAGVTPASNKEIVAPTKLLTKAQRNQLAKAQETDSQTPINHSKHPIGIASRTRSKTKQNQRKKTKTKASRNERRYRAWQEALRRRAHDLSSVKTPVEQISRSNAQGMIRSPRIEPGYDAPEPSTPNISTGPPNHEYQAIYAIDDDYIVRKPNRQLPFSHHTARLPVMSHREQILINSRDHNMTGMEESYAYGIRPAMERDAPPHHPIPEQNYPTIHKEFTPQDTILPSIEQPIDLTSPVRARSHMPTRQSQVMYQEVQDDRRFLPIRSNVTYVDRRDDDVPERYGIMVPNDSGKFSNTLDPHNDYARLAPKYEIEQSHMMPPSLRRVADVSILEDRNSIRQEMGNRLDYPGYGQRVIDVRGRDALPPTMYTREYAGNDQERRIIVDDDSSQLVRVLRRAPRTGQAYSRDPPYSEPKIYKGQRSDDQHYFESTRSGFSIQRPIHGDVRPVDSNLQGRLESGTRRNPSPHQHVIASSSTSLSNFSDRRHFHESNSNAVSYPSVSHSDHESRFSSARNEPILVSAQSSHQLTKDSFTTDYPGRYAQADRRKIRRPTEYHEMVLVEPRYISVDSRNRVRQDEQHYISTDLQGDIRKVSRQMPTGISDLNRPIYVRSLPDREEVIVLNN